MNVLLFLPFTNKILKRLEHYSRLYGLQSTLNKIAQLTQTKIEVAYGDDQVKKILESQACIIAANHPHEMEPLVLMASLPVRKDCYIITNYEFIGISPNVDEHLIPVYIRHHAGSSNIHTYLSKIVYLFRSIKYYSPQEEQQKNKESLKLASEKLSRGGCILIFPNRRSATGRWYKGIGYIVAGTAENIKGYYIRAYVSGTTSMDWLRLIPWVQRVMPKISIYFAKAIPLKDLDHNLDPKSITEQAEKLYDMDLIT